MLEGDRYSNFVIRYGPAVIFSNKVPGLDVNFIDPKYTETNPYPVTETAGYTPNAINTESIQKTNPKVENFDTLIQNMFRVMDITDSESERNKIKVHFILDYAGDNEAQMSITYEDEYLIVEKSNGDGFVDDLLYILSEGKYEDGNSDGFKNEKVYSRDLSYEEMNSFFSGDNAEPLNKLIKAKNWSWFSTDINVERTSGHKNYVDNEPEGYKNATVKNKSEYSDGCDYYWEENEGDSIITYKLSASRIKKQTTYIYPYTQIKVTPAASRTTGETKVSTAYELQKTISTWYKALRAIALVGLLSVLVYVGIRILISSTGQEKAKYKKMIGDWLAAICILFLLQYIMVFILKITQKITNILESNVLGPNGEDILMSDLRNKLGSSQVFSEIFPELLMYLVLVIYTVMFTIQYLKRLVYMAFFTMIAPLIALTYPLDKIKDGQAQAFSTWLREYIFNALLQPMHLLLYTIFVSSAMSLVGSNPLYAIVVVGFLLPAEKFFRKMFGFDKASSAGQLGAAAGGALIMNAINKMGHSSGKQAAAKAGAAGGSNNSSAGLRTASVNPLAGVPGGVNPPPGGPNPVPGGANPVPGGANPVPGGANPVPGGANPAPGGANPAPKRIKGIANLAKNQLFTRQAVQRNLSGVGKVVGGAAGLTAGLAAGISTGDLSNTFSYGAAGTVGGAAAGAGLVNTGFNTYDSAVKGIDNIRYGYQEGAYNEEYAQNAKFDREFKRSEEYKKLLKNYGKDIGVKNGSVDQMLSAGITDTTRMRTILDGMKKYNITDPREAIAYNQLANDCGDSILYDNKKLRMFLDKRGINGDLNTLRQSIINFK